MTAAAKSLQSCPTLCDPIDSSPPGSPVLGTWLVLQKKKQNKEIEVWYLWEGYFMISRGYLDQD